MDRNELPRWEHPEYYAGFSPVGAFVAYSVHRDSDVLERANYDALRLELIGAAEDAGVDADPRPDEESVLIEWQSSHWAVGWVRVLCVNQNAPDPVVEKLAGILDALEDYPVVDDDRWSEYEHEEIIETWANLDTRERIEILADAGFSVFAARREYPPLDIDDTGALRDALLY